MPAHLLILVIGTALVISVLLAAALTTIHPGEH